MVGKAPDGRVLTFSVSDPVSLNSAYQIVRHGRRRSIALTDRARNYRDELAFRINNAVALTGWQWNGDPLQLVAFVSFSPSRARDLDNLFKLMLDAFEDATGVDDSNFHIISAIRCQDVAKGRASEAHIIIWPAHYTAVDVRYSDLTAADVASSTVSALEDFLLRIDAASD